MIQVDYTKVSPFEAIIISEWVDIKINNIPQDKKDSKLIVCLHDQDKNQAPITLENPLAIELQLLNGRGFGIFETVNSFYATDEQLKELRIKENKPNLTKRHKEFLSQLTEVYADLDISKEEDKLPEDKREKLKIELKTSIDNYCPATFYVFTKNGLQPHWLIDEQNIDQATQTKYKNIIKGMIEWSKKNGSRGDPVHDITRFLRKPGYYHNKSEPYLVTEEPGSGKVYTLDELKNFFWKEDVEKRSELQPLPIAELNPVYRQVDELDIRQVVTDVWKEKGSQASFDNDDHLIVDGKETATFKGRLGDGNFIATTSSDYPAKGNVVTYTAETLGISPGEAFRWLCSKYDIVASGDVVDELPEPTTAEELDREEFSPDTWMIHRLVPENQITIISGTPSSFKTMSALEWAVKVASGEPAYEYFYTLKSAVLFISEDGDHRRIFQKRIRLLSGNIPNDLYFLLNVGFRVKESTINNLVAIIKKYNIKFIIFDSLRGIALSDFNEADASQVRQFVNKLRPLTAYGATILIIHHDRKGTVSGHGYSSKDPNDLGEMMSGSGDIRGASDCHLSIRSGRDKKEDLDYIVITQTKGREEEKLPAIKILVDKEKNDDGCTTKLRFVYDGEYAPNNAGETLTKAKEAILELLSKSSEKYVSKQTIINNKPGGFGQRTLEKALKSMDEVDKSIKSETGKKLNMSGSESKKKYYFIDTDAGDID